MTPRTVLVDNDIVFKLCAYARHHFLIEGAAWAPAFMLPFGQFVLRDLARKSRRLKDRPAVTQAIEQAIAGLSTVAPSEEAIALAAELEEEASRRALHLDTGESQLLAMLILESADLLLTGDKRAIVAIEQVDAEKVAGRVACLEQVLTVLLGVEDLAVLRAAICSEIKVDSAICACFACQSADTTVCSVTEGLGSYIGALRREAPTVLCETIE